MDEWQLPDPWNIVFIAAGTSSQQVWLSVSNPGGFAPHRIVLHSARGMILVAHVPLPPPRHLPIGIIFQLFHANLAQRQGIPKPPPPHSASGVVGHPSLSKLHTYLTTDAPSQLDILWHDSHTACMKSTQVHICMKKTWLSRRSMCEEYPPIMSPCTLQKLLECNSQQHPGTSSQYRLQVQVHAQGAA